MLGLLRTIHIIFGIFVAGYYMFMVPILMPRLKKLGPSVQGPVMRSLIPVLSPIMIVSFIVIVGTGIPIILMMRPGNLGALVTTGWGWAITIGFVLTLAAAVVGFGMLIPLAKRMERFAKSIEGRPPKPEEIKQMGQMSARVESLSNLNFVFVVIILLAMLLARYL